MIPIPRENLVIMMEGGYIYLRIGKLQEALDVFEGVSVLAPESEIPLVAMGSVYFGQMKYSHAIRLYKKAIKIKPDSAFARAYLGESLFFQGEKEMALKELEKASLLELDGKSGNFARVLLDAIKNGFVPPGQVMSP